MWVSYRVINFDFDSCSLWSEVYIRAAYATPPNRHCPATSVTIPRLSRLHVRDHALLYFSFCLSTVLYLLHVSSVSYGFVIMYITLRLPPSDASSLSVSSPEDSEVLLPARLPDVITMLSPHFAFKPNPSSVLRWLFFAGFPRTGPLWTGHKVQTPNKERFFEVNL